MTNLGFPYTYGDVKDEGVLDNLTYKGVTASAILIVAIAISPRFAMAEMNTTMAAQIADVAVPRNAPTAIGPVSAVCCAGAGYCAHIAQVSTRKGDVKAATAAACGALSFCCAQRVAQSYGV